MGKRVLVIGLDCVPPEIVFDRLQEELSTFSKLMHEGAYGRLESVIPPITVPAWACMMTGRTPGELGIYGFRNRQDYSYNGLSIATSRAIRAEAIWDHLSKVGKTSIVIGVPPSYPPKPLKGLMISCFLTPGPESAFTYPPEFKQEIEQLVGKGRYLFDVQQFRTDDKAWLKEQIFELTAQRFAVVRRLLATKTWDFFAFVDMGPDRLHHGFWKFWDPKHRKHEPGNPYQGVIPEYYRFLDDQLNKLLQLVDDETVVFIVSDHGAKRMDGGLCINEWLRREGFLALKREPEGITPLEEADVDWSRTVAWGEGGYYSRIFLNVRSREPHGVVAPSEYESVRDELICKLETIGDEQGQPIGTRVYRPEELYPEVKGIAPDLIAILGDLHWRSIGSLGWGTIWADENDTGPDDANHSQHGIFIAYGLKREGLQGELQGLKLLDIAPTLLELLELPVPKGLKGRSLLARAR